MNSFPRAIPKSFTCKLILKPLLLLHAERERPPRQCDPLPPQTKGKVESLGKVEIGEGDVHLDTMPEQNVDEPLEKLRVKSAADTYSHLSTHLDVSVISFSRRNKFDRIGTFALLPFKLKSGSMRPHCRGSCTFYNFVRLFSSIFLQDLPLVLYRKTWSVLLIL